MTLSTDDTRIVGEVLNAVANGPFIPDWEFQILFGVDRMTCRRIASQWPDIDPTDSDAMLSVNNSLLHMVGYPIDAEEEWQRYISVPRGALAAIHDRVRAMFSATPK